MELPTLRRRAHLYLTVLFSGFALCYLTLQLPDIAVLAFASTPHDCDEPKSAVCAAARSKASIALGLSNGGKAVVTLLLGPILGTVSDVHGRRLFLLSAQAACLVGYVAVWVHELGYVSLWPFLVLNSLSGLLLPAFLAVVADAYPKERRAAAFGLLMGTFDISIMLCPLFSASLTLRGGSALVTAAGAAGLALGALYGESLPPSQRLQEVDRSHWRPDVALGVLRSSPLFRRLSFLVLASTLPMAGQQQCFLLFMEQAYNLDRTGAAGFLVVLAVSGLLVQILVLPVLVARLNMAKALAVGLGLQLLQASTLTFVHSKAAVMVSCVFGGFGSVVFPCVCALKANAAPEQEQGRIQGAVSALQGASLGLGPVLYGAIFGYLIGPSAPGGHPLPAGVFFLSVMVLVPAMAIALALYPHLPEDMKHAALPLVRRNISLRRTRRASPGTSLTEDLSPVAGA